MTRDPAVKALLLAVARKVVNPENDPDAEPHILAAGFRLTKRDGAELVLNVQIEDERGSSDFDTLLFHDGRADIGCLEPAYCFEVPEMRDVFSGHEAAQVLARHFEVSP